MNCSASVLSTATSARTRVGTARSASKRRNGPGPAAAPEPAAGPPLVEGAGRGVLVAMNDRIVAARHAAKRHTTRVDAFGADGAGVLGAVTDGQVRYALRPDLPDTAEFSLAGLRALPPVDIVLDYQDAPAQPYAAAIRAGSLGIVVAAMGNGSLSPAAAQGCALAARRGLVCVRASRVPDGLVTDSGASGPLAAHALNPLQARIALRLALARGMDRAAIGDLLRRL